MLQFGHGGDAVGDYLALNFLGAGQRGFNSATAVTPWVTSGQCSMPCYQLSLQFGHGGDAVGDSASARSIRLAHHCFNSATAVTPWVTSFVGHVKSPHPSASIRPRR